MPIVLLSGDTLPPAKLSIVTLNGFPVRSDFLVALKSRARALLCSNKSQILLFSGWAFVGPVHGPWIQSLTLDEFAHVPSLAWLLLQRSPGFPSYCSESAEKRQNCKDTFHKDDERENKRWHEDGQDKSLPHDLETFKQWKQERCLRKFVFPRWLSSYHMSQQREGG